MTFIQGALVSLLLAGCSSAASNFSECVTQTKQRIENLQARDTLNLNLDCIAFDKVIIISHEISSQHLLNEIKLSQVGRDKIKTKENDGYYNRNWAIAWVKDSTLVNMIEFSPTSLMLENLVDGKGYAAIDRAELSPLIVVPLDNVFVGTQDTVLDVKPLNNLLHK